MRIKVCRSKNSLSYFVIKEIYRDNKRTTKVVESLGNHEEIPKNISAQIPALGQKNMPKD